MRINTPLSGKKSVEYHHKNLNAKSLAAYQELVEQEILPDLERESEGDLSKNDIAAIITRLSDQVDGL